MGGVGSTRWAGHRRKLTVEECATLTVGEVLEGTRSSSLRHMLVLPKSRGSRRLLVLFSTLKLGGGEPSAVELEFVATLASTDRDRQRIKFRTTTLCSGGLRRYFACPSAKEDGRCGRMVAKLYLTPFGSRWACRNCHELTYRSSQSSRRYDNLYALVAGERSGERFDAVKMAFSMMSKETRRRKESGSDLLAILDREFALEQDYRHGNRERPKTPVRGLPRRRKRTPLVAEAMRRSSSRSVS